MRIARLKAEGDELASYGPAKKPDEQGIDDAGPAQPYERGHNYTKDPTGRRTGNAPEENTAETLRRTLHDAWHACHKGQVAKNVKLTRAMLEKHIDEVRGAVMMAFPQGLPEWDPVREALEDTEDLTNSSYANDVLDPETAELWYAGKQMKRGKKLKDHLGNNEKTKIVGKLQKKGSGPPQKEPPISEEEHKQMMAYYHRKQEEQKKLEEADDDHHLRSEWADPSSLKAHFRGTQNIKLSGIGGTRGFNHGSL